MTIFDCRNKQITDIDALKNLIADTRSQLSENGTCRYRGFDFSGPEDVEEAITAISPHLETEYMGTSPRVMISKCLFTASELPGHYPIPQHCEMSFIKNPPRYLFFWCRRAPKKDSGETPTTDMRAVARDLPKHISNTFKERGLKVIRNYAASDGPKDAFQLKPWDEIFKTRDKKQVEAICIEQGFEPSWGEHNRLRLTSYQDAFRKHPETAEEVWFNHAQVFHRDGPQIEYDHIMRFRPSLKTIGTALLLRMMTAWKKAQVAPEQLAMHMTFRDGGEIPSSYIQHVSDAIWKNQRIVPWQQNDLLVIDNQIASHGRLPYNSPRSIAVAWANS